MPGIQYDMDDRGLATITLNRDEKRNAISLEMAEALLNAFERAHQDHGRLIVVRANSGVQVWCAGHDLRELDPERLDASNPMLRVFEAIQSIPLPVIAMVEGRVYAAGLILLLCADIVIAADNAYIAITSNRIGIPLAPEIYSVWLRVMGIHKAKELLFTASEVSPEDAYAAGLYNHVVQPAQLQQKTLDVAQRILECAPEALANAKFQLNLLARQTGLSAESQAEILARNSQLLGSPAVRARISALLESLE